MPRYIYPRPDEKVVYPTFRTAQEANEHLVEFQEKILSLPEFAGYGIYWEPRRIAGGFALVAAPLEDKDKPDSGGKG